MVFENGQKYTLSPENYMFRVSYIGPLVSLAEFIGWCSCLSNVTDSIIPTFHGAILYEAFKSARCILSGNFPKWK